MKNYNELTNEEINELDFEACLNYENETGTQIIYRDSELDEFAIENKLAVDDRHTQKSNERFATDNNFKEMYFLSNCELYGEGVYQAIL